MYHSPAHMGGRWEGGWVKNVGNHCSKVSCASAYMIFRRRAHKSRSAHMSFSADAQTAAFVPNRSINFVTKSNLFVEYY